jgi:hypothetical protein
MFHEIFNKFPAELFLKMLLFFLTFSEKIQPENSEFPSLIVSSTTAKIPRGTSFEAAPAVGF